MKNKIYALQKLMCLVNAVTLLTSPPVLAHTNRHRPVDYVRGVKGISEQNRAGYGTLGETSEAEAESVFLHVCPRDNVGNVIYPCVNQNSELGRALELASGNIETAFTTIFQRRLYEYLSMQRVGLGLEPLDLPGCLANDEEAKKEQRFLKTLKGKYRYEIDNLISEAQKELRKLRRIKEPNDAQKQALANKKWEASILTKQRAVHASQTPERLGEAMLLDRQLKNREEQYCGSDPGGQYCLSIRSNRDRIRMAFPVIFPGGLDEEKSQPVDGRRRWETKRSMAIDTHNLDKCGNTPVEQMENAMARMIGLIGAPKPMVAPPPLAAAPAGVSPVAGKNRACPETDGQQELAIKRGQKVLNEAYGDDHGYPLLVTSSDDDGNNEPDGAFNRANYIADTTEIFANDPVSDSRMVEAREALNGGIKDAKDVYRVEVLQQAGRICGASPNELKGLQDKYPTVFKQAVLDMDSESKSREATLTFLCKKNLLNRYQKYNPTFSCEGVTGSVDGADGMKVERQSVGFPFASGINYNLKKLPNNKTKITSKINYKFVYDPSIDPSHGDYKGNGRIPANLRHNRAAQERRFNTKVAQWITKMNAFYKKTADKVKDPSVVFDIQRCQDCDDDYEPTINVSECYRREEPSSFSVDHPGESFESSQCGSVRDYGNWQNAGNYTADTDDATIMHETGHALGLADEYTADYYPAHALGEDGNLSCNSTMASTRGNCHKIYPRHLKEIIRPSLICPKDPGSP